VYIAGVRTVTPSSLQ